MCSCLSRAVIFNFLNLTAHWQGTEIVKAHSAAGWGLKSLSCPTYYDPLPNCCGISDDHPWHTSVP